MRNASSALSSLLNVLDLIFLILQIHFFLKYLHLIKKMLQVITIILPTAIISQVIHRMFICLSWFVRRHQRLPKWDLLSRKERTQRRNEMNWSKMNLSAYHRIFWNNQIECNSIQSQRRLEEELARHHQMSQNSHTWQTTTTKILLNLFKNKL